MTRLLRKGDTVRATKQWAALMGAREARLTDQHPRIVLDHDDVPFGFDSTYRAVQVWEDGPFIDADLFELVEAGQ